jgi:hypothetical protein
MTRAEVVSALRGRRYQGVAYGRPVEWDAKGDNTAAVIYPRGAAPWMLPQRHARTTRHRRVYRSGRFNVILSGISVAHSLEGCG